MEKTSEFIGRALAKRKGSRSPLATIFKALAQFGRLRGKAIRTVCKLEGGQFWSETYRELMRQHYSIEIGLHSYGEALFPGMAPNGTRVGNYCSLAGNLLMMRRNHPTDRITQHPFFYNHTLGLLDADTIESVESNPLTIGNDVWIGHNVTVAPGCRQIGDSSVIAAGAVVTKDVPAFAIMGGVPAKLIRWRLPEPLQEAWLASRWWLKPIDELAVAAPSFLKPLDAASLADLSRALGNKKSDAREYASATR